MSRTRHSVNIAMTCVQFFYRYLALTSSSLLAPLRALAVRLSTLINRKLSTQEQSWPTGCDSVRLRTAVGQEC